MISRDLRLVTVTGRERTWRQPVAVPEFRPFPLLSSCSATSADSGQGAKLDRCRRPDEHLMPCKAANEEHQCSSFARGRVLPRALPLRKWTRQERRSWSAFAAAAAVTAVTDCHSPRGPLSLYGWEDAFDLSSCLLTESFIARPHLVPLCPCVPVSACL